MACSNCYNGCTEITSDQCVKYTGVDVPVLGILKGDSLSYVEQALITFLTATLNGSGITIEIDEDLYCELVSQYLQECSTVTAIDLFKALVQAACNLQEQVDAINAELDTLNADYTVGCLDGVVASDDTHTILQAVITKLCEIDVDLAALTIDVETNYVRISDINDYIAAYLADQAPATRFYTRMVPYCPIPYVGSLSFFDATGAGLSGTEWELIYLCNGLNGTPDMRGRVPVGAIVGVPGGSMDSAVDPASDPTFNPNYAVGGIGGANKQTLTISQMPVHAHGVTDAGHSHKEFADEAISDVSDPDVTSTTAPARALNDGVNENNYDIKASILLAATLGQSSTQITGISLTNTGGGAAHPNIQPVLATYYIMYIP